MINSNLGENWSQPLPSNGALIKASEDVAWQLTEEELSQVTVVSPSSLAEKAIDWVRSLNPSRFKMGETLRKSNWDDAVREARKKAAVEGITFVGPM